VDDKTARKKYSVIGDRGKRTKRGLGFIIREGRSGGNPCVHWSSRAVVKETGKGVRRHEKEKSSTMTLRGGSKGEIKWGRRGAVVWGED